LDEFNTCDEMDVLTEIINAHSCLGYKLPSSMKIIAACNPYKLRAKSIEIGLA